MTMSENKYLVNLVYLLIFMIVVLSGFVFGYLYNERYGNDSSLTSGLKKLNEINNANFSCYCISSNPKLITFSFDESGINTENYN